MCHGYIIVVEPHLQIYLYMAQNPPRRNSRKDHASESEQAQHMAARAELIDVIAKAITDRGWTQVEAARMLGVAQPRISDLMNGRTEKFTVDMLMIWLDKLGRNVSLSVNQRLCTVQAAKQPVVLTLYLAEHNLLESIREGIALMFDDDNSKYSLSIIDVRQNPDLAKAADVTSTPCLVRESPLPRVKLVGNLSPSHMRWCLP